MNNEPKGYLAQFTSNRYSKLTMLPQKVLS